MFFFNQTMTGSDRIGHLRWPEENDSKGYFYDQKKWRRGRPDGQEMDVKMMLH